MKNERQKEIPQSVIILGRNITRIIKDRDLKVRHVAHDADMDIEALRRYMKGSQIMGVDKFIRICKALQVQPNELLQEE